MKIIVFTFVLLQCVVWAKAQKISIPEIGIAASIKEDSLLHSLGYRYLVSAIPDLFSPKNITDEQFPSVLQHITDLSLRLYAVNIFIPGDLKLVGPDARPEAVLAYAEKVYQRCRQAGVKLIVLGSGGARRIPEGFSRAVAKQQFVSIARQLADKAVEYKIVLALENLNSGETNFITTLEEAMEIVKLVDHPALRLCADIYHMKKENEPASIIELTGPYLIHCDVAEKEGRTPPGTNGDNFIDYFNALKKIGYQGKIIIEANWKDKMNQALQAKKVLQSQLSQAYIK